jgi:hypothetical protein
MVVVLGGDELVVLGGDELVVLGGDDVVSLGEDFKRLLRWDRKSEILTWQERVGKDRTYSLSRPMAFCIVVVAAKAAAMALSPRLIL